MMMIWSRGPRWGIAEFTHLIMSLIPIVAKRNCPELTKLFNSELSGWNLLPLVSGKVALSVGLRILGMGEGDKIAIPSLCCGSVVKSIYEIKAKPVYVDMDPGTLSLSLSSLKEVIKHEKPSVIIMAHTIGCLSDVPRILSIARDYCIPVINDAAYLVGFKDDETNSYYGTQGNLGIWSFSTKGLQGIGGGMLLYPDDIFDKVEEFTSMFHTSPMIRKEIINKGVKNALLSILKGRMPKCLTADKSPEQEHFDELVLLPPFEGYFLASWIQIQLMFDQLKKREKIFDILKRNFLIFESEFVKIEGISIMPLNYGGMYVQYIPILIEGNVPKQDQKDVSKDWIVRYRLRSYLYSKGIQSYPAYIPRFLVEDSDSIYPNFQSYWKKIVFLPGHSLLSEKSIIYMSNVLKSWAENNRLDAKT